MKIEIVDINAKYYDALYEIHINVFAENDRMTKKCFYDEFSTEYRKYYVALNNRKEVCGYLCVIDTQDDYNIVGIAIKKEYQRQGIGKLLIDKIKAEAKINKVKTISLEVDEKNHNAIKFYKKNGFILTNIRKKYYKDNDAYIMWYYL